MMKTGFYSARERAFSNDFAYGTVHDRSANEPMCRLAKSSFITTKLRLQNLSARPLASYKIRIYNIGLLKRNTISYVERRKIKPPNIFVILVKRG